MTITVHGVDLAEVERRWRTQTVADFVRARPGGRVATLGAGRGAFAGRELFEALVEDLACASLHDAPFGALADVCERLGRIARSPALDLATLAGARLAFPGDRDGALVVWLAGADREAAARAAAEAVASPRGSDFGRELLEVLVPVLAGPDVVAQVIE
jgi:hypothetical protein